MRLVLATSHGHIQSLLHSPQSRFVLFGFSVLVQDRLPEDIGFDAIGVDVNSSMEFPRSLKFVINNIQHGVPQLYAVVTMALVPTKSSPKLPSLP